MDTPHSLVFVFSLRLDINPEGALGSAQVAFNVYLRFLEKLTQLLEPSYIIFCCCNFYLHG